MVAGESGVQHEHDPDTVRAPDIVVMDLRDSSTVACRKNRGEYERWLDEDYTTGDLWQMNLLGVRPSLLCSA